MAQDRPDETPAKHTITRQLRPRTCLLSVFAVAVLFMGFVFAVYVALLILGR